MDRILQDNNNIENCNTIETFKQRGISSNFNTFSVHPQSHKSYTLSKIHYNSITQQKKIVKTKNGEQKTKTLNSKRNYLLDGLLGSIPCRKCYKCIPPICSSHWVHHQTQVPYCAARLKKRYQFVFVHVFRYLTAKHFTARTRRWSVPIRRRSTILSLT